MPGTLGSRRALDLLWADPLRRLAGAGLLFLHTSVIAELAGAARGPMISNGLRPLRIQVVADAIAAIVLLVVTIGISVFKPHGLMAKTARRKAGRRLNMPGTRDQLTRQPCLPTGSSFHSDLPTSGQIVCLPTGRWSAKPFPP